jgi:riboflavin kinase/FMN adenylyltransferase
MIIIEDNFEKFLQYRTYVALGSFDGLHIGHMSLINKTIKLSEKDNAKSMVVTFKNHPLITINEELAPKLIMDNNSKCRILENLKLDILNMVNFDKKFMKMCPEDFILNLVNHYKVKGLIVGFNYRFGYKNLGDVELLKNMSKSHGFSIEVVEPVKYKGQIVSSSSIRSIIADEGNVKKAAQLLTRPYMMQGDVIKGKQLGRTLGFPTINLNYNKKFVIPRGGVYYTIVEYKTELFKGITNVGYNPTVNDNKLSIETYILEFNKDIYGEDVRVYFMDRIRDEKKFSSLQELIEQLKKDELYALKQKLEISFKN